MRCLKLIIIFQVLIFSVIGLQAQAPNKSEELIEKGSGQAIGKIVDSQTNSGVELATISVLNLKDSSLVGGSMADEKGKFIIENLPNGKYWLKISFLGYNTIESAIFTIDDKNKRVNLNEIKLSPSDYALQQVTITGEKALFQNTIDRKIFNVDKNLVGAGGTSLDALQNIPSVSVDLDGNVTLRGSGNVNVLIDGKPQSITNENKTSILQQLPASTIERIELITNPSSKFDAEGTAGIINIVLKKNKQQGYNGTIAIGAGLGGKYNTSANLNFKTSKYNLFTNVGARYDTRDGDGYVNRTNKLSDTLFYSNRFNNAANNTTKQGNARIGVDVFLNKNNTLSLSTGINKSYQNKPESIKYELLNTNKLLAEQYYRNNKSIEKSTNIDANANFRKSFKVPRQELIIDASFSKNTKLEENKNTQIFDIKDYNPIIKPDSVQQNTKKAHVTNLSLQGDYVHPFKQFRIETGAKTNQKNYNTQFYSETLLNGGDQPLPDILFNGNLQYIENIAAAYLTFASKIKKFDYQLGLRSEYSNINIELDTTQKNYNQKYLDVFPSAYISYNLKENNTLRISYSRRINRPNVQMIIGFMDVSDPTLKRVGNPSVKPEYINSIELSNLCSFKKGEHTLTSTAYFRQTKQPIIRLGSVDTNGIFTVMFANLTNNYSYGFEFILRNQIFTWWDLTSNLNIFSTEISGGNSDKTYKNKGLNFTAKLNSNFKFWKNAAIQLSANYTSPQTLPQGSFVGITSMDIGFKKDFLKNKLSFLLNIQDIFDNRRFEMNLNDPTFTQHVYRKKESRTLMGTLTYKFGSFGDNNKRKNNKIDDFGNSGGGMIDF